MSGYVRIDLDTDPDKLVEDQLEFIRNTHPNFDPAPGALSKLILQGNAEENAQQRFHMIEMSEAVVRPIGANVGIPPIDAAPAHGTTHWIFNESDEDGPGYFIPAGSQIGLTAADGSLVAFAVLEDVSIEAGESEATGVAIEAIEEGAAGTGLGGTATLLSDIADVESITAEGITSGGTDGEDDETFLDRWSDRMQLFSDRLIHADDFARYYRTAIPGCARAVALDTYDPDTETYDNEGYVTVAGVGLDGLPLSGPEKDEALALMQARSVTGQIIRLIDPEYESVGASVEVVALPGYNHDEVQETTAAAIADYLSPANHGKDPTGADRYAWINEGVVRYLELAAVINQVQGVHYIVEPTLEIEGVGGDYTLTGDLVLTEAGAIAVTVSP